MNDKVLNQFNMVLWMVVLSASVIAILNNKKMNFIDAVDERELNNIDAFRGILSLMVVFHHYILNYFLWNDGIWSINGYNVFLSIGPIAVSLFFILSGYLFSTAGNKSIKQWVYFYKKRIYRIVPLCLVSSLICICISYYLGSTSDTKVIDLARWLDGGFFNIRPDLFGFKNSYLINSGVTWTLHWEWMLYVSLPITAILVPKKYRLSTSVLIVALCTILWLMLKVNANKTYPFNINDLKCISCFSFGYICKYLENKRLAKILTSNKTKLLTFIISAVIIITGKGFPFYESFVAFLVFFNLINGSSLFGLLKVNGLRRLGVVSYTIYLMHGACWFVFFSVLKPESNLIFMSTISFFLVIILSTSISLLIEYPIYNWSKRVSLKEQNQIGIRHKTF